MILDYLEGIEIKVGVTPLPNYHSIVHIKQGICMLYDAMKHLETNYHRLANPEASEEELEKEKKTLARINVKLNPVDTQAVNLFHWYSINLINYVKCCGLVSFLNLKMLAPDFIAHNKKLSTELKKYQQDYIKGISEIEPVLHFRNKAGAHIAFSDPKHYDNVATLLESISLIPVYENGKIYMGALKRERGGSISSFSNHKWSLTDNFESLIPRFFGEGIEYPKFYGHNTI